MRLRANEMNPWLDDVRKYGKEGTTNSDPTNHTPMRRSSALSEGPSYRIESPIDDTEKNLEVIKMPVYTCHEMPPHCWMSRPLTNEELGAVNIIWRAAWPWLSRDSRRQPPNAWQYVIYQHILGHEMGVHRDNFDPSSVKSLRMGDCPAIPDATRCGFKNSQMTGTCVIVYSFGNMPMRMVFCCRKMNALGQVKADYEIEPLYCFEFGPGYISILDVMDDSTMLHGMDYVGVKLKDDPNTLVRVAVVIRTLTNVQEFYTKNSRLRVVEQKYRRPDEMNNSGVWRHAGT
jgi:hypothetical protein